MFSIKFGKKKSCTLLVIAEITKIEYHCYLKFIEI